MDEENKKKEASEIYLSDLIKIIYDLRKILYSSIAIITVISVIYALSLDRIYTSQLLMASSNATSSSPASSLASSLLGNQETISDNKVTLTEGLAILKSRQFIEKFVSENNFLPLLFKDDWDSIKNSWKTNPPPNLQDAFETILASLDFQDEKGLVYVSFESTDKEIVASLLNQMIFYLNSYTRKRAIINGEKNIAYLENEIRNNKLQSTNLAFNSIIEEQIQRNMITNGKEEYAFKVIDPARTPRYPSGPNRKLIVLIGFLLGIVMGSITCLIIYFYENNKPFLKE